jgi:hypothetical protein
MRFVLFWFDLFGFHLLGSSYYDGDLFGNTLLSTSRSPEAGTSGKFTCKGI